MYIAGNTGALLKVPMRKPIGGGPNARTRVSFRIDGETRISFLSILDGRFAWPGLACDFVIENGETPHASLLSTQPTRTAVK